MDNFKHCGPLQRPVERGQPARQVTGAHSTARGEFFITFRAPIPITRPQPDLREVGQVVSDNPVAARIPGNSLPP